MVLHLFPKSQFTEEFICFINEHFDKADHIFVVYSNKSFDLPEYLYELDNVYDYDKNDLPWLIRMMRRADRIIIHNLGLLAPELFALGLFASFARKAIWLIWGSDLYCYLDERRSLADKLVEGMRRRIIRSIPVIASLTDGDHDLAVKWYGCKGRNIRLDYCEEKTIRMMDDLRRAPRKTDGTIRILLGNSATKTNQHVEALHMLEHLKDENIRIYIPLSYGDSKYADEVIRVGRSIFGEKMIPLTEYMSRDEYYQMLYDIDVGVFNNNRQQGTGNIEALLYFGRKIYIRDDTSMWSEWIDKEGYILNNIKELPSVDLDGLADQTEEQLRTNRGLIDAYFDVDSRVKEWREAFEMAL